MTIAEEMEKLEAEINERLRNEDQTRSFTEHHERWWKDLNDRCKSVYEKAGKIDDGSLSSPDSAAEWLERQMKKLYDFMESCLVS